jgi:hypothetical protein
MYLPITTVYSKNCPNQLKGKERRTPPARLQSQKSKIKREVKELEIERIVPIAYFDIEKKMLIQSDGKLSSRVVNFLSSYLRESVNLLSITRLIRLKFRRNDFLKYVPKIKYYWDLIRFTFKMWMIWKEQFAQPNEKNIFFLDDPNLILTSVRARSLLFHFEKRFLMGTAEKIRDNKQLEIKCRDYEQVSKNEEGIGVKGDSSHYGMIFLERKFKQFNPLKRSLFQQNFVKKKTQCLFE